MTRIEIFTFEHADGTPWWCTTTDPDTAVDLGATNNLRVYANIFEYQSTELAWDFTEVDDQEEEELTDAEPVIEANQREEVNVV